MPKRKLGYYALPLLWRDRVIGWANVAMKNGGDRRRGRLRQRAARRATADSGRRSRRRDRGDADLPVRPRVIESLHVSLKIERVNRSRRFHLGRPEQTGVPSSTGSHGIVTTTILAFRAQGPWPRSSRSTSDSQVEGELHACTFSCDVAGAHRGRRDADGPGAETIQPDGGVARGQEARVRALCAEQSPLRRRTRRAPAARRGRAAPADAPPPKTPAQLAKEAVEFANSDFIFDGSMEGNFDRALPPFAELMNGMTHRRHPDQVAQAAPEPCRRREDARDRAGSGEGRGATSASSSISA